MTRQIRRRRLLGSIGAAATAGILAGCSTETRGSTDDGNGDEGDDGDDGDDGESGGGGVPSEVSDYLSNTGNFDGEIVDETGSDEVSVTVGGDGDQLFKPAAVRVSTGTTVVWEWGGGFHNVVGEGNDVDSGDPVADAGKTYEYTFEETGNYRYYCTPHEAGGMKGAVVVE